MSAYTREMTSTEKVYIACDRISSPFVNQMILEGTGVLDKDLWVSAVKTAAAANPGTRLVMRGPLCFNYWVASDIDPDVREVNAGSWSGFDPDGAPFLDHPLSPVDGPTCEVVLIHGNPLRVAFRSHHAVMDGRGTLCWAEDVFRALRGETPIGYNSRITEIKLAKSFQKKGRTPAPARYPAVTGPAVETKTGFYWKRVSLPTPISSLLPKVAVSLAHEIWQRYPGCPVRFGIPVDMRPRGNNILSTGNLTNLIYLDVTPNSTPETISSDIKQQLANHHDGMIYWMDLYIKYLPIRLIQRSLEKDIVTKNRTGLYRYSGIISNPGRLPLDKLSGGGFQAAGGFFIPINMQLLPVFVGLTGTNKSIELVVAMPNKLASHGRLENILNKVASYILTGGAS
ncbi:MAG: hypothetical protein ACOY31_08530 [Bacillota bacterium]